MVAFEVCMVIIGVIFILGSFMITEKMSPKELEKVSEMTKEEMERLVEKQMDASKEKIQQTIDDEIEESVEKVQRSMEKESNDKIMSISEYSDGVLENINKTHTEVMFLYSMLTDKEEELKGSVSEAQVLQAQLHASKNLPNLEDESEQIPEVQIKSQKKNTRIDHNVSNDLPIDDEKETQVRPFLLSRTKDIDYDAASETDLESNNKIILQKHNAGYSNVQIAKELGLGLGEVKLVIDLYKGAKA